jgi:hypothetical protein
MASDIQELRDTYQTLYKSLTEAYWVASTVTDKDRIRGTADAVYDLLSELTREEIKSRGKAFENLRTNITLINDRLQTLQSDITKIVHNVDVASRLTTNIAKAITAATSLIAV